MSKDGSLIVRHFLFPSASICPFCPQSVLNPSSIRPQSVLNSPGVLRYVLNLLRRPPLIRPLNPFWRPLIRSDYSAPVS